MSENIKICFIGGDKRQRYAAENLCKNYIVCAYGENFVGVDGVKYCENTDRAIYGADVIVLPLPISKYENIINFSTLADKVAKSGAILLGGKFTPYMKDIMNALCIKYIDYYEDEVFTLKNAYLTAEGVLNIAMNETEVALSSLKIAVMGYGRIASYLCEIIKPFGADITVYARREEAIANASIHGYNAKMISFETQYDFDFIFNTIPERIITNEQLLSMSKDTCLVELASLPGGFDADIAEQCGLRVIKAPGIPGKYAPKSAGIAVAETVIKLLNKEGYI